MCPKTLQIKTCRPEEGTTVLLAVGGGKDALQKGPGRSGKTGTVIPRRGSEGFAGRANPEVEQPCWQTAHETHTEP